MSLAEFLAAARAEAEAALLRVLPPAGDTLADAMRYSTLAGGKRLRPALALALHDVLGGSGAPREEVAEAAAALELVHTYSLVHDDLPCMDDDVLRRGRPTCHVAFGEATALLAGDALQAQAFQLLAGSRMRDPAAACAMLAEAAGVAGMAGGQAIDLDATGRPMAESELEHMHRLKTGALIRASVRLGAAAGRALSPDELAALDAYAAAAGLAFQVVDDVLDVEGSTATLGKTAGKDAANAKPTYPAILGMEASRRLLDELTAEATAALAPLGAAGADLAALARFVAERDN